MKIVASTKLARAQKAMSESRTYGQTSNTVFEEAETKRLDGEANKKILVVVCSSDKGLCGGIHSGMTRATRRLLADKPDADLVIIGEKCKAQLGRSNPKQIQLSFAGVGKEIPTFSDAQAIADQISMLPSDYSSITIMYNKFINAQSYEAVAVEAFSEEAIAASRKSPFPSHTFVSVSLREIEQHTKSLTHGPSRANAANFSSFEIDDEVLGNMQEYALANSLFWALAEGHACEISARRNAMDNASKNAGDMINRFQILYNRTRQAVITGELVEIITGASASEE